MLGVGYRITVYNGTGASITIDKLTIRRFKFDSNGARVFEPAEVLLASAEAVASAASFSSGYQDNTSDGWLDAEVTASITASGSGLVTVRLDRTTDGGTTYPTVGDNIGLIYFSAAGSQSGVFATQ